MNPGVPGKSSLLTPHCLLLTPLCTSHFSLRTSEIPALDLLCKVVSGSPRERQYRQCRILLAGARERRAVHDEDVLHVVHLVELVERRSLGILAHAAAAVLVDGRAVAVKLAPRE